MPDMPKPAAERLVVCVGASSSSARVITAAHAMADRLDAKWSAVNVEPPRTAMLSATVRQRTADNLRLAEQLGAEVVSLSGTNIADAIVEFARKRRVTRVIVGKPARASWRSALSGSPVDRLVRADDIDVYVTTGEPVEHRESDYVMRPKRIRLADYGGGILLLTVATAICFAMYPYFHLSNLIMVYLLAVMLTATECGRGPAILTSLLSVLAFDVCFVPPRFSLTVEEAQYLVTFAVMTLVALVISHLAAGMREQAAMARLQERQAAAMHGLSRQLASTRGTESILELAVRYISDILDCDVSALLPDRDRKLKLAAGDLSTVMQHDIMSELRVAHAAYESGRIAGWGTQVSPTTENLYVPLRTAGATAGVLALRPRDPERFLLREQMTLLESLAQQVALALQVERMSAQGRTFPPTAIG